MITFAHYIFMCIFSIVIIYVSIQNKTELC